MNSTESEGYYQNPLIESSSADTLNNIGATMAFVQWSLTGEHAEEILKDQRSNVGLSLVFDCILNALDFESAKHDPANKA